MALVTRGRVGYAIATEPPKGPTLGQALARLRLTDALAVLGFVIVLVGSIAPWATSPLVSPSGFDGDGKITAAIAVLGVLVLLALRSAGRVLATFLGLAALGLGIYEYLHIHHAVRGAVLFGVQVVHVGWGVYAVILGGAVALVGSAEAYIRG